MSVIGTTPMYVATRICFRFLCLLVQADDQSEIKAADKSLIQIIFLLQIKQFKQNDVNLNEFEIATFICCVSSLLIRASDTFIETLNILIRCK